MTCYQRRLLLATLYCTMSSYSLHTKSNRFCSGESRYHNDKDLWLNKQVMQACLTLLMRVGQGRSSLGSIFSAEVQAGSHRCSCYSALRSLDRRCQIETTKPILEAVCPHFYLHLPAQLPSYDHSQNSLIAVICCVNQFLVSKM